MESVTKPLPHTEDCPPPQPPMKEKDTEDNVSDIESDSSTQTTYSYQSQDFVVNKHEPHLIRQGELNDLVRDLNLSKAQAELLSSRLQQWNLLHPSTKVSVYRQRDAEFVDFFKKKVVLHIAVMCRGL